MAKWEDLPVQVDEAAAMEIAAVREQEMQWRKQRRTGTFGRLLLGMVGLLALHGYIAFCVVTDPVIAWGSDWMASDKHLDLCISIIPILFVMLLAVAIGLFKSVIPERNKGLYYLGLGMTVLGILTPLVVLFSFAALEMVGILLVAAAFVREDFAGDARVKQCTMLVAGLYALAALAALAFANRANAFGGLLVISLWLSAAFTAYLTYLAAHGHEMPWRWASFPAAGRERVAIATAVVVACLAISGGLVGAQFAKVDLEIISAIPYEDGFVDVMAVNKGGWPAEGEIVLYGETDGNLTELGRTGKIEGFGRWLERIDVGGIAGEWSTLVLYWNGKPVSQSYVGAGENVPCVILYPAVLVAAGAVFVRTRRRR